MEKTERLIVTGWPARARWVVVCAFFLAVNWLLLAPASAFEEVREFLPHQDKLVHGSLFLTLAFLVRWSLAARDGRGWQRLGVFTALVLYAGASEALQPVLGGAGRRFDWLDMASNLAGVCAGWLLFGMACVRQARPMKESWRRRRHDETPASIQAAPRPAEYVESRRGE